MNIEILLKDLFFGQELFNVKTLIVYGHLEPDGFGLTLSAIVPIRMTSFSNLPNPILSNRERDKTSWFDVNGFLCKCLGLDIGELEKVKSLKLEDLPNDWEFVVKLDGWGGKNMKWLVHGLEHDKKIRRD